MSKLLVISSAPATVVDEKPFLDIKFTEGMRSYSERWDGPVSCILTNSGAVFPYGKTYDEAFLPFGITLLPPDHLINAEDLAEADIVMCSGDDHLYLHLADVCRSAGKKIAFNIEYIPETRRQIISLDQNLGIAKKLRSMLWIKKQEKRRIAAFGKADGVQANGYPAFTLYRPSNARTMLYLDGRMEEAMMATEAEMKARRERLISGKPLRLIHSGRLEPMKGSQDLVPIAKSLSDAGVAFSLDIFGAGSLEASIRDGVSVHGLSDCVTIHGPVDFKTELVPFARKSADIYLSCHRQSDPSCTYVESMGCGLAVAGYVNRMWAALCDESKAGWKAPLGRTMALADALIEADKDREGVGSRCDAALAFAREHSFESEFSNRIDHLKSLIT